MKKILIALAALFIINLGCKKITEGGQPCACSPIQGPTLSLTIKSSTDVDLLNSTTTGYFNKDQIKLYSKDANNVIKQISFSIGQPFTYTSDLKITYYQLRSDEIAILAKSIDNNFYLKLGEDKIYELNLKVNGNLVEKLLINKAEAPKEIPNRNDSFLSSMYTLKFN
ncbi:hypothetical protein [Pedobacter nototheniae]|uniref:hypothetical protein n=1 Tax=Pedobacter nototheniae TaxID=2488994 RepID=UPI00103D6F41|nr:hypothetical protein [Pedobacter nototheniae]